MFTVNKCHNFFVSYHHVIKVTSRNHRTVTIVTSIQYRSKVSDYPSKTFANFKYE